MQKQGPEGAQQRTAAAVTGQQRGRRVLHHPSLADSAAAEAVSLPPRSSGTSYSKGMGIIIRGGGSHGSNHLHHTGRRFCRKSVGITIRGERRGGRHGENHFYHVAHAHGREMVGAEWRA